MYSLMSAMHSVNVTENWGTHNLLVCYTSVVPTSCLKRKDGRS